jgi:hypothetical protein
MNAWGKNPHMLYTENNPDGMVFYEIRFFFTGNSAPGNQGRIFQVFFLRRLNLLMMRNRSSREMASAVCPWKPRTLVAINNEL